MKIKKTICFIPVLFLTLIIYAHADVNMVMSTLSNGGSASSSSGTLTAHEIVSQQVAIGEESSGGLSIMLGLYGVLLEGSSQLTWYLAEGCTAGSFSEWILLENPNSSAANVKMTFTKSDGSEVVKDDIVVPATGRYTLCVNDIIENDSSSVEIESLNGIGVIPERSMYWDAGGIAWAGGHNTYGVQTLSTTWYFAEGCTKGSFDEWILISNPNTSSSDVTITFVKDDGSAPVTHDIIVSPNSRYTLHVNNINGLANSTFSAKVESTNAVTILAERAMYWNSDNIVWKDGHCSTGAPGTDTTWYLAEGCTAGTFDDWILIMNPTASAAAVRITFIRNNGADPVVNNITVPALSRYTLHTNEILPNESFSTKIESTNAVGIVAERAMYWNTGAIRWAGGHCSMAINNTDTIWYLAEGCTASPFDDWILIMNPTGTQANVRITFMKNDGTTIVRDNILINPLSRYSLYVNSVIPNEAVSAKIESTNSVGIVAERSMYWYSDGFQWLGWIGGHCSVGVRQDTD